MLGTEVEHLLSFLYAPDDRPGDAPAVHDEGKGLQRSRVCGGADEDHRAVRFQQMEIRIVIMDRRHRIEDEVEMSPEFCEVVRLGGHDKLARAESFRIRSLCL